MSINNKEYIIKTIKNVSIVIIVFVVLQLLLSFKIIDNYTKRVLISIVINCIMVLSLNLIVGFSGQLTLGHAAFMSIGAYVSAVLTKEVGSPFIIALLGGCIVAGIVSAIVGFPILRLKGGYLGMCTLGFSEIVKVCIQNIDKVGGARGYSSIPIKTSFAWAFFLTIIIYILVKNLINSSYGRVMVSVKEDIIASEAMGNKTQNYKMLAFIVGSSLAGIAGGLYAHYMSFIEPSVFGSSKSTEYLTIIVIGGMGSLSGSILGAVFLTLLPEVLRNVSPSLNEQRMLIYGVVIILMMLFRPQGIMGTTEFSYKGLISGCVNIIKKVKSFFKAKKEVD